MSVGGFSKVIFFPGEEQLLCYDLAAAGWDRAYVAEVVAHHHPLDAPGQPRPPPGAGAPQRVAHCVMHRPPRVAVAAGAVLARAAVRDTSARRALRGALVRLPAALRRRAPLPAVVEQQIRLLEDGSQ